MHRMNPAFVGAVAIAASAALFAGCNSNQGGGVGSGEDAFQNNVFYEISQIYRDHVSNFKKPPSKMADLAQFENGYPTGVQEVRNGNVIVFWGAPLQEASSDIVLAYQKAVPQDGGYVLMQDGTTIVRLTAGEFESAKKAGELPKK